MSRLTTAYSFICTLVLGSGGRRRDLCVNRAFSVLVEITTGRKVTVVNQSMRRMVGDSARKKKRNRKPKMSSAVRMEMVPYFLIYSRYFHLRSRPLCAYPYHVLSSFLQHLAL